MYLISKTIVLLTEFSKGEGYLIESVHVFCCFFQVFFLEWWTDFDDRFFTMKLWQDVSKFSLLHKNVYDDYP